MKIYTKPVCGYCGIHTYCMSIDEVGAWACSYCIKTIRPNLQEDDDMHYFSKRFQRFWNKHRTDLHADKPQWALDLVRKYVMNGVYRKFRAW